MSITTAKSVHWTELRIAINAARQLAGLMPATWTENVAVGEIITRTSIEELRNALDPARSALGLPALPFTDYPLPTNALIKAVHLMQLREGVE